MFDFILIIVLFIIATVALFKIEDHINLFISKRFFEGKDKNKNVTRGIILLLLSCAFFLILEATLLEPLLFD